MGNIKVPKLTPHNYATWLVKKWCELMNEEVFKYVDRSLPKPTSDKVTQSDIRGWELADRKSLGILRLGINENILY